MKSSLSTFQLIVLVVFIFIGILGVVIFAGFGGSNKDQVPTATIWGTVPAPIFNEVLRLLNQQKTVINVKYEQIADESFRTVFVNALAEGRGPDIVLLTDDLLYAESNKLAMIPYTVFTQRDYADTYINAADHFMTSTGVLGVPFTIDPIVLYWNRNMLSTAGITSPPKTWGELEGMISKLTRVNDTKGIEKSAIALGEMRNINNSKEILASMLMQAGNNITDIEPQTGTIISTLDKTGTQGISNPADAVIKFYTAFANPNNVLYSWSRSLPDSRAAFLAGDLAMYIGYTSEFTGLRIENPNLDIDIALLPQNSDNFNTTYGKITAFSVTNRAQNPMDAYRVIALLTSPTTQKLWSDISHMPPVRKDLLNETIADKYNSVFYRAAVQAKTWFDPEPAYSDLIFRDMIESITTGKTVPSDAISNAKQRLDLLLRGIRS